MERVYEEGAKVFKALGDPRRQKILALLRGGEKCACKLIDEMDMPQSSLSYHMKILCECGLVNARKEGKWSHYSLNRETLEALQAFLAGLGKNCECKAGCCQ